MSTDDRLPEHTEWDDLFPEQVLIGHALDSVLTGHSDRAELVDRLPERVSELARELGATRYGGTRQSKWRNSDHLVQAFIAKFLRA